MKNKPDVYLLPPDGFRDLPDIMEKAGIKNIVKKDDFAAVKVHFGEKGNKGYVKPREIKPVIKKLREITKNVFITDANTIYRGERTDAVSHLMVAAVHNFHPKYLGVPVIIADGLRGNSYFEVEIGQKHFKKVKISESIHNSDVIIAISHFKGHELCGVGGAIKNLGMGCASRAGKYEQHNSVVPKVTVANCTACGACVKWCGGGALKLVPSNVIARPKAEAIPLKRVGSGDCRAPSGLAMTIHLDPVKCTGCGQCILACNFKVFNIPWNENAGVVQEKMAEYALGTLKDKRSFYINFLTFLTPQCDCFKTQTKPLIPDVGILASTDPVAIDKASMDLIEKHAGRDIFKEHSRMDGSIQIKHAAKLGLGSMEYKLV